MSALLLSALVLVAVGACVQGVVGFGMNLVAAPLLLMVDPVYVPGPLLVAGLTLGLLVLLRDRRSVALTEIGWALAGRVPGSVLGVAALAFLTRDALALTLAVLVLAAVGASVAGVHVGVGRVSLVGAGALSGFTATTTSVGGPPMALLYQRSEGAAIRANLGGFFLVGGLVSLALLVAGGHFGAAELRASARLVPAVVVGFGAAGRLRHHVDGERARPAVLVVAAGSALALIVRTLVG